MNLTPELMLGILGAALSIIALIYSWANSGKQMENRITTLEANQFTADDRRCLYDLETKMNTIWKFFEMDLPRILKSPHTPELDILLEKAENGLGSMKVDEVRKLYQLIDLECASETPKTEKTRVLSLSMYRTFLQHELAALNILI
ncbi:MAG: hypothetical protein KAX31_06240 [Thermoplasmata archaeon]|nr:hypothetical protein [Thermoplasmata archaeon]